MAILRTSDLYAIGQGFESLVAHFFPPHQKSLLTQKNTGSKKGTSLCEGGLHNPPIHIYVEELQSPALLLCMAFTYARLNNRW
jgi:hypothetical protein